MPINLKKLAPPIEVGDKLVHVGTLTWGGIKAVQAEFSAAKLPLPKLAVESIREGFAEIQAIYAKANGADDLSLALVTQAANAKLYELLARLASENLPILTAWITGHPPIITALVEQATNLSPEEIDKLSAGQLMRVARAAWDELVADGFFSGAAGFFAGLVGLKVNQAPDTSKKNQADPASQSPPAPSGEASPSEST